MIRQSDISPETRILSDRMHSLSMMTEIPDMWEYAEAWNKLAADFKAIGYESNAERCIKKFEYYREQKIREENNQLRNLVNQSFRTLYCPTENTWTRHALNLTGDTYVCGCGYQQEYHTDGRRAAVVESEE